MDWNLIKSIVIPEGNVKKITANGSTLWEKASGIPYVPITSPDTEKFPAQQNSTILYELFTSDDSVWNSVERVSDGAYGYYCEEQDVFVEVKGIMDEPVMLMGFRSPNPNPEPIPEEDEELTAEPEPEEQPKLVCPYCGKEYKLEFYFNKHVAAHEAETEGGES